MLQQERHNDFQEALRLALNGFARTIWCCGVGIVTDTSNYQAKGTISVQLAIQAIITSDTGVKTSEAIDTLLNVPVTFLGGGGAVATFPITVGDEALVIFADRCIDAWFVKGGVQQPLDPRAHSLSDGFAFVGPRSMANLIPNLSTTTAQLRSLDGTTYFEIGSGGAANIVAPGGLNITASNVNITGTVNVTGAVSATEEGTFNGIPLSQHIHGGVATGPSDTAPPTA